MITTFSLDVPEAGLPDAGGGCRLPYANGEEPAVGRTGNRGIALDSKREAKSQPSGSRGLGETGAHEKLVQFSGLGSTDPGRGLNGPAFSFGEFRLEADGTLLRGDAVVHLPPRELAALRFLAAHAGQIVTPLQLREALWGDVHVTEDSVPRCVSSLRARLEPEECIQTAYKRGYRFSAEVRRHDSQTADGLPRLAVLPFENGFNIPEHLGQAIAEEAITRLTAAPRPIASMLARDSVFTLARRGLTAQQIGETLKADFVLAGILRALPSHYRLRAEMIRVEDGTQIWVEDLLVRRDRIAGLELELVTRLLFRMTAVKLPAAVQAPDPHSDPHSSPGDLGAKRRALVAGSKDPLLAAQGGGGSPVEAAYPDAYNMFQRAHHEWQTLQRHRMQDGLQNLLRATELDPSLIAAKVDLVRLCTTQAAYGIMSPAAAADIVHRTAESIEDIQIQAPAILPSFGNVSFHTDRNLATALWAFSVSAHLPHDPWTTRARVMFALGRHRFEEAIGLLRDALIEDPLAPWLHARLAWALHLNGQAEESMEQMDRSQSQFPGHVGVALYGAMILPFNGDAARGMKLAEDLAVSQPFFDIVESLHAYTMACAGHKSEARATLERLQWMSRERYVLNSFSTPVHVALGDHESALSELRAAEQNRCPWFFQMLADPRLKPLHGRREFAQMKEILTRMEAAAQDDPVQDN
jgi:DNA-binding winged helix-turn-helix (wHTH) protein/tetratricopeptide (TPR) repeat protein